jgi:hypothetical protein
MVLNAKSFKISWIKESRMMTNGDEHSKIAQVAKMKRSTSVVR